MCAPRGGYRYSIRRRAFARFTPAPLFFSCAFLMVGIATGHGPPQKKKPTTTATPHPRASSRDAVRLCVSCWCRRTCLLVSFAQFCRSRTYVDSKYGGFISDCVSPPVLCSFGFYIFLTRDDVGHCRASVCSIRFKASTFSDGAVFASIANAND